MILFKKIKVTVVIAVKGKMNWDFKCTQWGSDLHFFLVEKDTGTTSL